MFPQIKTYQITGELGRGGMATVYKAWQPSLSRHVALKMLPPYFSHDEELLARFRSEAQAVAKLCHPHIVRVYDFTQEGDWYYLAMELISGGSLSELLAKEGRLPLGRAIELARQTALGLHHAHEKGFVHRDIKPSNILLNDNGEVVITDFGIAKALEGPIMTQTATAGMGTSEYMSPEQSRGEKVDRRSDLYSLGALFFEMLTGSVPFFGDSPMAVMHSQIYDQPAAPSALNPGVPAQVEEIVLRLLAKRAEDRYQDGLALVKDIDRVKTGEAARRRAPAGRPTLIKEPGKTLVASAKAGPGRAKFIGPLIPVVLGLLIASGLLGYVVGYQFLFVPKAPAAKAKIVKARPPAKVLPVKARPEQPPQEAAITGLSIEPARAVLTVGDALALGAVGARSDNTTGPLASVVWRVSNPDLAGIEPGGKVTALAAGAVEVEALHEPSGLRAQTALELVAQPAPEAPPEAPVPARPATRVRRPSASAPPAPAPSPEGQIPITVE